MLARGISGECVEGKEKVATCRSSLACSRSCSMVLKAMQKRSNSGTEPGAAEPASLAIFAAGRPTGRSICSGFSLRCGMGFKDDFSCEASLTQV